MFVTCDKDREREMIEIHLNKHIAGKYTISRRKVRYGKDATTANDFITNQIVTSGMFLIISHCKRVGIDYRTLPYLQEDNIEPAESDILEYRYTKDYVTITNDSGDYITIRWNDIKVKD